MPSSEGAAGVVIYNNAPGILSPTVEGDETITIPVVLVSQSDGASLVAQVNADPTSLTWTTSTKASPNPTAGVVSDFSSFGMSADLTLNPDVAAPGGNIWSTFPIETEELRQPLGHLDGRSARDRLGCAPAAGSTPGPS